MEKGDGRESKGLRGRGRWEAGRESKGLRGRGRWEGEQRIEREREIGGRAFQQLVL